MKSHLPKICNHCQEEFIDRGVVNYVTGLIFCTKWCKKEYQIEEEGLRMLDDSRQQTDEENGIKI